MILWARITAQQATRPTDSPNSRLMKDAGTLSQGGALTVTKPIAPDGQSAVPQSVTAPLTRTAIFLVVAVNPGAENRAKIRALCGDLAALVRSVGQRVPEGELSCCTAFGSEAWDQLFGHPRPAALHRFGEIIA